MAAHAHPEPEDEPRRQGTGPRLMPLHWAGARRAPGLPLAALVGHRSSADGREPAASAISPALVPAAVAVRPTADRGSDLPLFRVREDGHWLGSGRTKLRAAAVLDPVSYAGAAPP